MIGWFKKKEKVSEQPVFNPSALPKEQVTRGPAAGQAQLKRQNGHPQHGGMQVRRPVQPPQRPASDGLPNDPRSQGQGGQIQANGKAPSMPPAQGRPSGAAQPQGAQGQGAQARRRMSSAPQPTRTQAPVSRPQAPSSPAPANNPSGRQGQIAQGSQSGENRSSTSQPGAGQVSGQRAQIKLQPDRRTASDKHSSQSAQVEQPLPAPRPRPLIDPRYGYPGGPEGPVLVFWRGVHRAAKDLEGLHDSLEKKTDNAEVLDMRDLAILEILKRLTQMQQAAESAVSPAFNASRAKARDKWIERKENLDLKRFDSALRGPEKSLSVPGDPSKCLNSLSTSLVRNPSYLWHAGVVGSLQYKIARAEAYLRTISETLAPSTEERYDRSNRKTKVEPWTEEKWLKIKRPTRRNYIASMRRKLGALLEGELSAAKQQDDVLEQAMRDELKCDQHIARELVDVHKEQCSISLGTLLIRLSWLEIWAGRTGDPANPSEKRKRKLKGLPDDWVDQVLRSIRSDAKWRTAAAVMALAGARPAEVSGTRSAVVTYDPEAHTLTFDIEGAKVKGDKGQAHRILTIRPDESFACKLVIDACLESGGTAVVSAADTDKFRDKLNERIKAVIKKPGVSCYCFRHQVSSDIKKQGVDSLTTANALGHRSTRTQGGYGAARTGRAGGPKLLDAEASAPVRQPDRQKPWGRKPEPEAEQSAEDLFSNIPKPS